jgi:hypothetical protein
MKWIAAVLMIVNVVIFLGVSDRQVESALRSNDFKPDVNRESMMLLQETLPINLVESETQDPDQAQAPTLITAPDVSSGSDLLSTAIEDNEMAMVDVDTNGGVNITLTEGAESGPNSEPSEETQEGREIALAAPPGQFSCYRVGPFKDKSIWQGARQWVTDQGLEFVAVRSESRELRAVRVYVGPFDSINAAQQDVDRLDNKELDFFVYLRDNGEARISLGYFTQEELAAKFVDYLSTQEIEAKSQPEYRTLGPFDWMDINVKSTSRWDLLERDWQDAGVKVTERQCTSG